MKTSDWIIDNLDGEEIGGSIVCTCPLCDKEKHLYIHAEDFFWRCFKCGETGHNIYKLVAVIEGITETEARKKQFKEIVFFRRQDFKQNEWKEKFRSLLKNTVIEETINVKLPDEFIKIDNKIPVYLKDRGFDIDTVRRFELGYCNFGRYTKRIVFPIRCPNGYAFTSRTVCGVEPKYLHPSGAKLSNLIYGWKQAAPKVGGEIILVEGTFDVIRLSQHGIVSLGLFGKQLHKKQKRLITGLKPSSVTVMLDSDDPKIDKSINDISLKLSGFTDVYIARLPYGIDPGDSTKEQAWTSYRQAVKFKLDRRERISKINIKRS